MALRIAGAIVFVGGRSLVYLQWVTEFHLPMRRILVLTLAAVLVSAFDALAQSKPGAPPSVSCLGPEGESYLRDLLARIHQLEQELDAAKHAQLAEREQQARRLQAKESEISDRAAALTERERARGADLEAAKQAQLAECEREARRLKEKEAEISERAAALSEREQSRAADLEAAKQELEKLKASSARAADVEQQLAGLKRAVEEANDARLKVEAEMAAAKRESQAREAVETRFGELEQREQRRASASSRREAESAAAFKEASPPTARESAVAPSPTASRGSPRAEPEAAPSAKLSESELAAAQLAALGGKPPPPAPSEPGTAAPDDARRSERILPGERLTLRVAKVEELNRTVEVGDDGSIDLPLVGMIQAAGRTEPELVDDLRERLTAYLKEPHVEVSREGAAQASAAIADTKPASAVDAGERAPGTQGSYSVEGRVARPGTYEVTAETTVTSAIAAAGGISFGARLDEVEIEHPSGGADARHEIVNVAKLGQTGGSDVPIRAGDVVRVPGTPLWALPWGIVRIVTFPLWYPFS